VALNKSFFGLPIATLEELLNDYVACLKAIAVAGASYSIAGRSFSRANLNEVSQTVKELQAALDAANGRRIKRVVTAFASQRP
jgi:outer membrane murein-binding lipoprotein Lpp